jgi:uncharacterized protein
MPLDEQATLQLVRDAKTIAVLGMQDEAHADRPAYAIPAQLLRRGYTIYPVNPKIQSSLGLPALARLADLPVRPDILDVFRRSEFVPAIADEVLALPPERRPKAVWLQSGITHPAAEAKLEAADIAVVADRCLGVYAARIPRP